MTHRQYQAWQAWLDMDMDQPDRHDHYLMGVACEVRRTRAENPNEVQPGDLRLEFQPREQAEKEVSVEEATRMARGRWAAVLGG